MKADQHGTLSGSLRRAFTFLSKVSKNTQGENIADHPRIKRSGRNESDIEPGVRQRTPAIAEECPSRKFPQFSHNPEARIYSLPHCPWALCQIRGGLDAAWLFLGCPDHSSQHQRFLRLCSTALGSRKGQILHAHYTELHSRYMYPNICRLPSLQTRSQTNMCTPVRAKVCAGCGAAAGIRILLRCSPAYSCSAQPVEAFGLATVQRNTAGNHGGSRQKAGRCHSAV